MCKDTPQRRQMERARFCHSEWQLLRRLCKPFSYGNFDHPVTINDQATITGRIVLDDGSNTPVAGAQVVATGINYTGYTTATTNSQGLFDVSGKALSQAKLQAFSGVNNSPFTETIYTPAEGVIQLPH